MQAVSFTLDQPKLIVTFNGTEYECERQSLGEAYYYGAPMVQRAYDFSEYPFVIATQEIERQNTLALITQTVGTYTLNISAEDVETSECFGRAVKQFSRYMVKFFVGTPGGLYDVMMVDSGAVLGTSDSPLPTPPSGTTWLNVPTTPITSDITIHSSNPVG